MTMVFSLQRTRPTVSNY